MDRKDAAEDRKQDDGRTAFERFVERVNNRVSEAPFFVVCLGIVLVWGASAPLWPDLKEWQVAIHTVASVMSLLLLVLLENSGRRAQETAQEKLNVIAEALAELMESHSQRRPRAGGRDDQAPRGGRPRGAALTRPIAGRSASVLGMASHSSQVRSRPTYLGAVSGQSEAIQAGTSSSSDSSTGVPTYSSRTHHEMSASAPGLSVGSM